MSYRKYFKDVSGYDVIDVYRTHRIFGLTDEVLCHASKKLLLSGVRTGGKTLEQDVREARDSLNRWLEMLQEDLGNSQEKDGWTPEAISDAAFRNQIKKTCESPKPWPDGAEVEWPDESRIDVIGQNGNDGAVYSEYTSLQEVVGDAVLSDWARWVAVDKDGEVYEYSVRPDLCSSAGLWIFSDDGEYNYIKDIEPPADFTKCIWEVKN